MRSKKSATLLLVVPLVALFMLGGCNLPANEATPTPGLNATQSYETAVARVTQFSEETQAAIEGVTLTASPSPLPVTPSNTPGAGTPTATPVPPTAQPTNTPQPCDKAAPGSPIDVTIEDGTKMVPGQEFVKTWRLVNAGTCTWTTQYAVVWASGAQIGDQDVVFLNSSVGPGQTIDISVPMTAPDDTGEYQSNWKLRNAQGVLFGIGNDGSGVFWARIEVVLPTTTPTPSPTATSAVTLTPTPVVFASGSANVALGDSIDLDSLAVNPGGGTDLSYALDGSNNHLISPLNGARMGVFGGSVPNLPQCQATSLATAPLAIESVGVGTYLCFQTDSGRYGQLQITSFDNNNGALVINVVVWVSP